jgi:tRNA A22 N-methylase
MTAVSHVDSGEHHNFLAFLSLSGRVYRYPLECYSTLPTVLHQLLFLEVVNLIQFIFELHRYYCRRPSFLANHLMSQRVFQVAMFAASLLMTGCFRGGNVSSVFSLLSVRSNIHCSCKERSLAYFQRLYVSSSPIKDLTEFSVTDSSQYNVARTKARDAFSFFAQQGRAWRRLSHLVDLSILGSIINNNNSSRSTSSFNNKTIVDLGTDHGLLAMGLTLSGKFRKVIGVDVSEQALENGALLLLEQLQTHHYENKGSKRVLFDTPVEFRHGDGLKALSDGEADIVCIAGIGVNTILQILQQNTAAGAFELDRIRCTDLILQPTNSKPRYLMLLYKTLQERGWEVYGERIEKVSSRWYVTTHFARQEISHDTVNIDGVHQDGELHVPGSILSSKLNNSDPMQQVLKEYYRHHENWIRQDSKYGMVRPLDTIWLERIAKHPEHYRA